MDNSRSRKILIGITGSIAAYKMADVVSELVKRGHEVRCILTESAAQFVSPLVLETLSRNPVHTALFGPEVSGTEHISLARWPELVVIAPATANTLTKISLGLADDLLATVVLATQAPILVGPAMNTVMWEKPVIRQHVEVLRARGLAFVEPASGTLACGEVGAGKLATVAELVEAIEQRLPLRAAEQDLRGRCFLVTAGPTTTAIDAVRYITNHSTGAMGAAMAEEALRRGAEVRYVLGIDKGVRRPVAPPGAEARLKLVEVRTAEEMYQAALAELEEVEGVIAAAAVMDYSVERPASAKLKRAPAAISLSLVPSIDVLAMLREKARPGQWFLGFAAETDDLAGNAALKLKAKRLDHIFANWIARTGETLETGFAAETNGGLLLSQNQPPLELPVQSKAEIARQLWNRIA
jgi:phosphopantothenoylcysteine decarboxylase/phosphopantothenate--cysteine ligase